jgi:hypothetical protein
MMWFAHLIFWTAVVYTLVGVLLTIFAFSQTPYADNPWWEQVAFWPWCLFG